VAVRRGARARWLRRCCWRACRRRRARFRRGTRTRARYAGARERITHSPPRLVYFGHTTVISPRNVCACDMNELCAAALLQWRAAGERSGRCAGESRRYDVHPSACCTNATRAGSSSGPGVVRAMTRGAREQQCGDSSMDRGCEACRAAHRATAASGAGAASAGWGPLLLTAHRASMDNVYIASLGVLVWRVARLLRSTQLTLQLRTRGCRAERWAGVFAAAARGQRRVMPHVPEVASWCLLQSMATVVIIEQPRGVCFVRASRWARASGASSGPPRLPHRRALLLLLLRALLVVITICGAHAGCPCSAGQYCSAGTMCLACTCTPRVLLPPWRLGRRGRVMPTGALAMSLTAVNCRPYWRPLHTDY
jgi:hypothetical protein